MELSLAKFAVGIIMHFWGWRWGGGRFWMLRLITSVFCVMDRTGHYDRVRNVFEKRVQNFFVSDCKRRLETV